MFSAKLASVQPDTRINTAPNLGPRNETSISEIGAKPSLIVTADAIGPSEELTKAPAIIDQACRKVLVDALERQPKGELERVICECKLQVALDLATKADQATRKANEFALCYTSCFGDVEIASTLIERGWDVNSRTSTNGVAQYPLLLAMATRRPELVQLLLQHGADIAPEPAKSDKMWVCPVGAILSDRWLAIRPATESSDAIACITSALNGGWSIDRGLDEENEKSLLWQAITCRPLQADIRSDVINFLLEKGASPLKRVYPYTMLGWAVEKDCPEAIPLLLKNHAEQQLSDRCDWSSAEDVLCRAVRLSATTTVRSLRCVTALLAAGANVHSKNEVEQKLLPASMGNVSRLKKMVRSNSGKTVTPMEIAVASGNAGLKRLVGQYDTPRGFVSRPGR
jgi:hypothetical protein